MKTLLFDHGLTDYILDNIIGLNNTWNSPVLLRSSRLSKNNKRPLIGFSQESSPFSQESNGYESKEEEKGSNKRDFHSISSTSSIGIIIIILIITYLLILYII